MVDVSVSGMVRADPDDVFAFLADLENWPRSQSDMQTDGIYDTQSYHFCLNDKGEVTEYNH
jgi:hypothetical protein